MATITSTYSSPTPPAHGHRQRDPSVHSLVDHSHSRNRYKAQRARSRQTLSSAFNDEGSDVDVTLDGSSITPNKGEQHMAVDYATVNCTERPENDSMADFGTTTTYKGICPSYQDPPDHLLQSARPRLVGSGVGAVNRHLNGSTPGRASKNVNVSSFTARASAPPRAINHTKGLVPPAVDTPPGDLNRSPPVETGNMLEHLPDARDRSMVLSNLRGGVPTFTPGAYHHPTAYLHSASSLMVPSAPFLSITPKSHLLPDLTRFASAEYIASLIAASPAATTPAGNPITRPFSLAPLPYTDEDIPIPQPYNTEYPHPITAYASPRVNPETVKRSGYGQLLKTLVEQDLPLTLGSRLYDAGFRDLDSSVYLLFSFEGSQGNGIPESLWSKLENVTSSRLPVGSNGVSPFARSTTATSNAVEMPPRFAQLSNQAAIEFGMLTPPGSTEEVDYFTKPINNRLPDYDPTPRPSPDYHSIKHASSMANMRVIDHCWDQRGSGHRDQCPPPSSGYQPRTDNSATSETTATGISPFYKTELCAIWQQTGKCKYGGQCQYAHGVEELRLPRHLQNAARISPPAKEGMMTHPPYSHEANKGMVYPSPTRSISLRPHARGTASGFSQTQMQARSEPRRSSCPPQQLAALAEGVEDDHSLPLPARHQSLAVPAPIGAERPIPTSTTSNNTPSTRSSISSAEKWEDMPPFTLAESSFASTQLRSESSRMSLSLSTSSSSGYSLFTDYGEKSTTYSPIEGDITISDHDRFKYGYSSQPFGGMKEIEASNNGHSLWK
ncbi:uncharacterized protein L199_002325 [Kwoniella botswanensis]|uniref:uncharacterized protein n=1 Tax=Kwoniella botswanensis TaxID=1268659 RepID=UPI00315C4F2C